MKMQAAVRLPRASKPSWLPTKQIKPDSRGFSLLEMGVCLAITGVLIVIALPSYQAYTQRSRRAKATQDLLHIAQSLEQAAAAHQAYPKDINAISPYHENYVYGYREAPGVDSFVLMAIPIGSQTSDHCATLLLDQRLVRGAGGVLDNRAALTRECWER